MRVLVAGDKPRATRSMQRALEREGYSVSPAFDGDQALAMGIASGLDVMVLDAKLAGRDGFDVVRNLRAANRATPAILLGAQDAISDVVRGLDLGADDYLAKPFAMEVLLARVRALARRGQVLRSLDLEYDELRLNSRTHQLQRGERTALLTPTEFALLETLMRRAGWIVPRGALVEAGWGAGAEVNENTLYVFIRSLRSKITRPGENELLHTARGIGYTLRASRD